MQRTLTIVATMALAALPAATYETGTTPPAAVGSITPADAPVSVAWAVRGSTGPFELETFDDPVLGTGVAAAGYTGGVSLVTASGERWRSHDGYQLTALAPVADLTGDGIVDVAAGFYPHRVVVIDGATGSAAAELSVPAPPEGLAVGDATGDGVADLYVVTRGGWFDAAVKQHTVRLLEGGSLEEVWAVTMAVDEGIVMAADAGDLDGDGRADLVFGTRSNGPRVHAWDADGEGIWSTALGGTISGLVVADDGATVFASVTGTKLSALDATDGSVRWDAAGTSGFARLTAADLDGDGADDAVWSIYGAAGYSPTNQVQAVAGEDGTLLWTVPTTTPPKGLAVGDLTGDGTPDVAVTTQDPFGVVGTGRQANHVSAIEGRTGAPLWTHVVAGEQMTIFADVAIVDVTEDGTPEVVAAPYTDVLLGLAAEDGSSVWEAALGAPIQAATAADLDHDGQDEIITASDDLRIVARDAATGTARWVTDVGVEVVFLATTPGPAPDVIAVGRSQAFGLDGDTGAVAWTTSLPGWIDSATVFTDGRPLLAIGSRVSGGIRTNPWDGATGTVTLVDVDTGAVRWTIPTPGGRVADLAAGDATGDGVADVAVATAGYAASITLLDGTDLEMAPTPAWTVPADSSVIGVHVTGGSVLAVQPSADAVAAYSGDDGTESWRTTVESATPLGWADTDGDGIDEAIVGSDLFRPRVAVVDGAEGTVVVDLDTGLRFLSAAAWTDADADGDADLLLASDGGVFGEGAVFALDGTAATSGTLVELWRYAAINAWGLEPVATGDASNWFAYGFTALPAAGVMLTIG
ncbi:MAG: PQQ-binding-like beta-propeller repeat protein [Actinobacteria bacterium]|nr:PQQ-binding-like beta-propeller repeat protein [Actinomycetota bacterium]